MYLLNTATARAMNLIKTGLLEQGFPLTSLLPGLDPTPHWVHGSPNSQPELHSTCVEQGTVGTGADNQRKQGEKKEKERRDRNR